MISRKNHVSLGFNYNTDYDSSVLFNTDLKNIIDDRGSKINFDLRLSEYPRLKLEDFIYYGIRNKVGTILTAEYNEKPVFVYEEGDKKAELKTKTFSLEAFFRDGFGAEKSNRYRDQTGIRKY